MRTSIRAGQLHFMQTVFFPDLMTKKRNLLLSAPYLTLFDEPVNSSVARWKEGDGPFVRCVGEVDPRKNIFAGILKDPDILPGTRCVPFVVNIKRRGRIVESPLVHGAFSHLKINYHRPLVKIHLFKLGFAVISIQVPFDHGEGIEPDNFIRAINYFNWEPQKLKLAQREYHKIRFRFGAEESGEIEELTLKEFFAALSRHVIESIYAKEFRNKASVYESRIYPLVVLRDALGHQWSRDEELRADCLRAVAGILELVPSCESIREDVLTQFLSRFGIMNSDYALPTGRMCICAENHSSPREKDYVWHLIYSLEMAFALSEVLSYFCEEMSKEVRSLQERSFDVKTKMKNITHLSGADKALVESLYEILSYEELITTRYLPWYDICRESLRLRETIERLNSLREAYIDLGIAWRSPLVDVARKVVDLSSKFIP